MAKHREFILAGVLMKQHLSGQDTSGSFSLFENVSAADSRTPIHQHEYEDETLYMLAGEMCAVIAGKQHWICSGESIFLPRGTPHQLMNVSGYPARYLLLCTPGGFEAFLSEAGHIKHDGEIVQPPSATELEKLRAAAPKHGITLLQNW